MMYEYIRLIIYLPLIYYFYTTEYLFYIKVFFKEISYTLWDLKKPSILPSRQNVFAGVIN